MYTKTKNILEKHTCVLLGAGLSTTISTVESVGVFRNNVTTCCCVRPDTDTLFTETRRSPARNLPSVTAAPWGKKNIYTKNKSMGYLRRIVLKTANSTIKHFFYINCQLRM